MTSNFLAHVLAVHGTSLVSPGGPVHADSDGDDDGGAGVMHWDSKPESFLLTDRGEQAVTKTADFGLCICF